MSRRRRLHLTTKANWRAPAIVSGLTLQTSFARFTWKLSKAAACCQCCGILLSLFLSSTFALTCPERHSRGLLSGLSRLLWRIRSGRRSGFRPCGLNVALEIRYQVSKLKSGKPRVSALSGEPGGAQTAPPRRLIMRATFALAGEMHVEASIWFHILIIESPLVQSTVAQQRASASQVDLHSRRLFKPPMRPPRPLFWDQTRPS